MPSFPVFDNQKIKGSNVNFYSVEGKNPVYSDVCGPID